jgi:7-carboxy-7-deazaguanine synthase
MSLVLAVTTPGEPEIFASLQGEGPSAGRPCAFVRLSRCNLACTWCDTAYTWRFTGPDAFDRQSNQITLDGAEVAARIMALGQDRLVITGGEPLLQGAALARMVAGLAGITVEIETNGTVASHAALDPLVAHYTVSPKLEHSGNTPALALIPQRLSAWAHEPKAWFKFVISAPEQVSEVLALAQTHGIAPGRIYLMPEGTDSATLRARERWLAPLALAHGLRLSDRLHIHLYGDTRGT